MRRAMRMRRFILFSLLYLAMVGDSPGAQAQTTHPVTEPTAPGLQVHEWAVFVLDGFDNQLNPDGKVLSTLPAFVNSHRQAAMQSLERPFPVGVIRIVGTADSKVDVKIEKIAGTFLTSWPTAQTRSNQLLWQDLRVADAAGAVPLEKVSDDNWFNQLRESDSAYLMSPEGPPEQFLLYDIEMPYDSPLKATSKPDGTVDCKNLGEVPLHDLVLYRTTHDTLMQASVGDLGDGGPSTRPTTAPTTAPTGRVVAHLAAAPSTQPAELASSWKQTLSSAGMTDAEAGVAVQIIAQYAFDPHSLTAVYRMDDAEFDRLLPLEVVPQPQSITRIGLVIVRNFDASATDEIDDLIAQLGDPVWSKRQAAYDALKALGPAAQPRLRLATGNKDVEIAWRAERLLATPAQQP